MECSRERQFGERGAKKSAAAPAVCVFIVITRRQAASIMPAFYMRVCLSFLSHFHLEYVRVWLFVSGKKFGRGVESITHQISL